MPDGELETVPDPDFTIDKLHMRVNVAVTVAFVFIATLHVVPIPEQPPDQPEKTLPELGVA